LSKDETTQPTPRVLIGPATEPNPPWTNKHFDCAYCGAEYQLGCVDECDLITDREHIWLGKDADISGVELWFTPPCWTCGERNVVTTPRFEPEGNPS
jgi:hypothetical protein